MNNMKKKLYWLPTGSQYSFLNWGILLVIIPETLHRDSHSGWQSDGMKEYG